MVAYGAYCMAQLWFEWSLSLCYLVCDSIHVIYSENVVLAYHSILHWVIMCWVHVFFVARDRRVHIHVINQNPRRCRTSIKIRRYRLCNFRCVLSCNFIAFSRDESRNSSTTRDTMWCRSRAQRHHVVPILQLKDQLFARTVHALATETGTPTSRYCWAELSITRSSSSWEAALWSICICTAPALPSGQAATDAPTLIIHAASKLITCPKPIISVPATQARGPIVAPTLSDVFQAADAKFVIWEFFGSSSNWNCEIIQWQISQICVIAGTIAGSAGTSAKGPVSPFKAIITAIAMGPAPNSGIRNRKVAPWHNNPTPNNRLFDLTRSTARPLGSVIIM